METLLQAFSAVKKPYQGKNLAGWLSKWVNMPVNELEKLNSQFLATMATWVVRKFGERNVPVGNLERFVLPTGKKLNLMDTLMAMVVMTLRRRGLIEADSQPTAAFQRLVDAFDRTPKRT